MADLAINLKGIKSPNPFWIASGPAANTKHQAINAFEAGWGGVVWKTIGNPIKNVSSLYGAVNYGGQKVMGFTNLELISDRGVSENLKEIQEVKRLFPQHAIIASLMVESREEWQTIVRRCEDAGADGIELNFGCPHGMCERGMGSAVGQEPKILEELLAWVTDVAKIPVLAKLTPNITDIIEPGLAAQRGHADGVSLINTIKSIVGVDLDDFVPFPKGRDASTNGGYCGPAVKPIALHMVGSLARHEDFNIAISGIGGISDWRDAAEFIALGCTSVQACTAPMHYGYRIVEDMIDGLNNYLNRKGMKSVDELRGRALPQYREWGDLDINYKSVAVIHADKCIGCQLCYIACEDGSHQAISIENAAQNNRVPKILEDDCVGCNLCALVCPVDGCITMEDKNPNSAFDSWNQMIKEDRFNPTDTIHPAS